MNIVPFFGMGRRAKSTRQQELGWRVHTCSSQRPPLSPSLSFFIGVNLSPNIISHIWRTGDGCWIHNSMLEIVVAVHEICSVLVCLSCSSQAHCLKCICSATSAHSCTWPLVWRAAVPIPWVAEQKLCPGRGRWPWLVALMRLQLRWLIKLIKEGGETLSSFARDLIFTPASLPDSKKAWIVITLPFLTQLWGLTLLISFLPQSFCPCPVSEGVFSRASLLFTQLCCVYIKIKGAAWLLAFKIFENLPISLFRMVASDLLISVWFLDGSLYTSWWIDHSLGNFRNRQIKNIYFFLCWHGC